MLIFEYAQTMNSQTHLIMSVALFGRRSPKRAWVAALGGVLPDVPMLLIVLVLKLFSVPSALIFGVLYWQEWWQVTNAIAHNFFLWGGLLAISLIWKNRQVASGAGVDRPNFVAIFAASALLHTSIDFLCHREDAHMSFWPLTRWKFISPVSYYDSLYYGQYFSIFEAALGLFMALLLFQRFPNLWLRMALGVAMLLYIAVPAYFILL